MSAAAIGRWCPEDDVGVKEDLRLIGQHRAAGDLLDHVGQALGDLVLERPAELADLVLSMRFAFQQTMRDALVTSIEEIAGRAAAAFLRANHLARSRFEDRGRGRCRCRRTRADGAVLAPLRKRPGFTGPFVHSGALKA
jgi:hypothetical protein